MFEQHDVDAAIHVIAKKAVGTPVEMPVASYDTNVGDTTALLRAVHDHGAHDPGFSSSCSIDGNATKVPVAEEDPVGPTNPYATSKWPCEQALADTCRSFPSWPCATSTRSARTPADCSARCPGECPTT
ncbi:GDP-mannose 4,6-dehydratase [Streptomyces sp. NPDC055092]